METTHSNSAVAAIVGATVATAAIGSIASVRARDPWYQTLQKSELNPPNAVFGPVWTALYALTTISGVSVYRAQPSPCRTAALTLYGVQQTLNAAWSPLFFGAKKPRLALLDLTLLFGSLVAYAAVAAKVKRSAALLIVPSIAWVAFAGFLNAAIVNKNPPAVVD